jgi:hypothetical protein
MVSVASAQTAWVPLGKMTCKIEGWATDTDPKGLNVRAKPSTKARILGTLPPYVSKENFGIEINIIGSQRGWLRITNATDNPDRSLLPLRKPYSGTGGGTAAVSVLVFKQGSVISVRTGRAGNLSIFMMTR